MVELARRAFSQALSFFGKCLPQAFFAREPKHLKGVVQIHWALPVRSCQVLRS
jgi:hypothetical protein